MEFPDFARFPLKVLWCLLLCGTALAQVQPDTVRLAHRLARFRGFKTYKLSGAAFRGVQDEYLAWLDVRIRAGRTVEAINEELKTANLLTNRVSPDTADDEDDFFERNYAGYVDEVEVEPTTAAPDLMALRIGIPTGSFCGYNQTLLVYQRQPLRRIAQIDANAGYDQGYYLDGVYIGTSNTSGLNVIATAWAVTNCTSVWNGSRFRLDVAHGASVKNLLNIRPGAKNGEVEVWTNGDTAEFRYVTHIQWDPLFEEREAALRYRVVANRATRLAPIARSYGAYIDEWLKMDDKEAARWGSRQAASVHRDLSRLINENFTWERAAVCPGSPATREITLFWAKPGRRATFAISGDRADSLRFERVTPTPSPGCREIDIRGNLSSIMNEPYQ